MADLKETKEQKPIEIKYETLKEQVEKGMKRKELAEFYGLPESNMAKILKDCGLKIRKFHKKKYVITGLPDTEKAVEEGEQPESEDVAEKPFTGVHIEHEEQPEEEAKPVDEQEAPVWD